MRTQIWIIAAAFVIFGIIGLIITHWSPSYIGLIIMGGVAFGIGALAGK